jgi:hypothetical protein
VQKERGVLARTAVSGTGYRTALPASALRQWSPARYLQQGSSLKFYTLFLEISMEFKTSENVLVYEHMHFKFTKRANMTPFLQQNSYGVPGIKNQIR